MMTEHEISVARHCIDAAVEGGADAARATLSKCVTDSCTMLNGELDKVSHCADRSIYLYLFVDGRYGTFSTNRLDKEELTGFVLKAIDMVRMLGEDRCRQLPARERKAVDAVTGHELALYDSSYEETDTETRLARAEALSIFAAESGKNDLPYRIISEECEYSDSYEDTYVIDSQGFEGRHTETSFSSFSEMTIEDSEGNKYSGYWWESAPFFAEVETGKCGPNALEKAVSQIGPKSRRGGSYRMVVDRNCASRLISPIFTALNASSIQQKMSFLDGTLDRQVFPAGLTVMDFARTPGKAGSRLFDTEGVATEDAPIIEDGFVRRYFVNTYMSAKTGMEPTVEDISRPCVMPYLRGEALQTGEKEVSLKDILRRCGSGIYVTGFNGGNCNPVTGDFSFGIEGFAFSRGRITHPVREMLITGNLMQLWQELIAAGSDARKSARWQIPTLAFDKVSFSS